MESLGHATGSQQGHATGCEQRVHARRGVPCTHGCWEELGGSACLLPCSDLGKGRNCAAASKSHFKCLRDPWKRIAAGAWLHFGLRLGVEMEAPTSPSRGSLGAPLCLALELSTTRFCCFYSEG